MLSPDIFNLWFAPLKTRRFARKVIGSCSKSPNDFSEVWLKDNYMSLLKDVVSMASGRHMEIRFQVPSASAPSVVPILPAAPAAKPKPRISESSNDRNGSTPELSFNPKNTFESFVVGNNNNFAYASRSQL